MLEEREVDADVVHLAEVLLDDRLDLLVRAGAGRALEVGELEDLHLRFGVAAACAGRGPRASRRALAGSVVRLPRKPTIRNRSDWSTNPLYANVPYGVSRLMATDLRPSGSGNGATVAFTACREGSWLLGDPRGGRARPSAAG